MASKLRLIFAIILLVIVLIFTFQNTDQVGVRFLIWEPTVSRALLLFSVFLSGGVLGWIGNSVRRARHRQHERERLQDL